MQTHTHRHTQGKEKGKERERLFEVGVPERDAGVPGREEKSEAKRGGGASAAI